MIENPRLVKSFRNAMNLYVNFGLTITRSTFQLDLVHSFFFLEPTHFPNEQNYWTMWLSGVLLLVCVPIHSFIILIIELNVYADVICHAATINLDLMDFKTCFIWYKRSVSVSPDNRTQFCYHNKLNMDWDGISGYIVTAIMQRWLQKMIKYLLVKY